MKIPTFEEFSDAVREQYEELVGKDKNANKYWESDEAQQTVRNSYEAGVSNLKAGKGSPELMLSTWEASSCAYCLHLMYDLD